eukprot:TRINITY_DN10290_c0_g1_i1.p1 TRINITY_DN10290_c0_g1~~TRINITY_DN10290_c0_g1_i1.p1  ORF type:complete len:351 (-),score=80.88 TRINITY_DN10290_c0_g1_i1:580-1632(-)
MKAIFAVVALVLVACCSAALFEEREYQQRFVEFIQRHKKVYDTNDFFSRYTVFKKAVDYIETENKKGHSYTLGTTVFADLTNEEYRAQYTVPSLQTQLQHEYDLYVNSTHQQLNKKKANLLSATKPPLVGGRDWSSRVSGVRDQGTCRSAWAFAGVGAIEGAWAVLYSTQATHLSEQQPIDCCSSSGCAGCVSAQATQYGSPYGVFSYASANGLCHRADYPYAAMKHTTCSPCETESTSTVDYIYQNTGESNLVSYVYYKPAATSVDASSYTWQYYTSGILSDSSCGNTANHFVLAYKYTDSSYSYPGYFKVKNSVGTGWGESGTARISRGDGTCGIGGFNYAVSLEDYY